MNAIVAPMAEVLGLTVDEAMQLENSLLVQLTSYSIEGREPPTPGVYMTKMMFAGQDGTGGFSVKWRNMLGFKAMNPRSIKDLISAVGLAGGAVALHASAIGAFLLATTVLAVRPVSRDEALVMHMAHRIARADGTFTLVDMLDAADELRDGYLMDKVGEADLRSHLNNLERAGALYPTPTGYRLAERIVMRDPSGQ
ncbi:hypothetical protein [uncultured Sphingomonas sp.]|uniref:hypothetical protein n=1 Tax=uncultured Sphingomonas sp. TaxID=158754 RepID=UPI0025E628B7|nr:hypothetical protein [uncultured Sphingomonas sp.]